MSDPRPTVKYKNPWHNPRERMSSEFFETDARPVKYKDCLIYHRIKSNAKGGDCWDVVVDGVCVKQLAGLNGAKRAIDSRKWEKK